MGSKAQEGTGGQGNEPAWVDRPITDEQLEAAWRELREFIVIDVIKMFRRYRKVRPFRREIRAAVEFAFEEAAIRRPGHPKPRAWLRTVAFRTAIRLAVKRLDDDRMVALVAEMPDDRLSRGQSAPVEETVETIDVLDAIARLPELQRTALGLEIGGYTHSEIAARMQITPYAVANLVRTGRNTLREHFRS